MRDLEAAKHLVAGGFWNECAFHCQQAAEKGLKALWIDVKRSDPPRVHWAERLAQDLGAPPGVVDAAAILVSDYITSRYPAGSTSGPYGDLTSEEAGDRLDRAEAVLVWVSEQWSDEDD